MGAEEWGLRSKNTFNFAFAALRENADRHSGYAEICKKLAKPAEWRPNRHPGIS